MQFYQAKKSVEILKISVADNDDEPPAVGSGRGVPGQTDSTQLPPTKLFKVTPLVITQNSNRQLSLNDVTKSAEDLPIAVERQFKEREANRIYRPGTNQIEKSVYLRVSRNLELSYLIGLIDSLYGAGANSVYLKTWKSV
jgi:biopolymer transport protein ExbD